MSRSSHASILRALRVASFLTLAATASAAQIYKHVSPALNDTKIVCTEFVCKSVASDRISFARYLETAALCDEHEQELMSPGARVNFRSDARYVRFSLEYLGDQGPACEDLVHLRPGYWKFGLEVDGVLKGADLVNQGGSWSGTTFTTDQIYLGTSPSTHDVSLIWPLGSDVDLKELQLSSVQSDPTPSLYTPNARPQILLGVCGDSMTHGLFATHVTQTYPALLAENKGWSVINMGYAGRKVVASDAKTARGLLERTCAGAGGRRLDVLLLAFGSNDFNHPLDGGATDLAVFKTRYQDWISNFRDPIEHESTPILCVTPIPRGDECSTDPLCARDLEAYRLKIRAALHALNNNGDGNVYLFEGRDLIVPSSTTYDTDGLHPTDVGFAAMAANLQRLNLARNPGFELKALVCDCPASSAPVEIAGDDDAYLWKQVAGVVELTSTHHDGIQALRLGAGGNAEQMVYSLGVGDGYALELYTMENSGAVGTVTMEYLDRADNVVGSKSASIPTGSTWVTVTLTDTVPSPAPHLAPAVRARIRIKNTGTGFVYVDDLLLKLDQLEAL